jgi:phosphate starvation-inducible PhoH-like protein
MRRRLASATAPDQEPMTGSRRLTVGFKDNESLRILCGERDANLRWLEDRLEIQVLARGQEVHLQGAEDAVTQAAEVLSAAFANARAGGSVDPESLSRLLDARQSQTPHRRRHDDTGEHVAIGSGHANGAVRPLHVHRSRALNRAPDEPELGEGTRPVQAKTPGQRRYVEAMRDHEVVFGVGPAGSGKTYLAMAAALAAMQRREVKRIVLTRPAVEAGEHLGFLPGDLTEKVSPYLRPLYDALRDLVDQEKFDRLTERGQIEVAPLAFMRGRTLSNAFVILDEAQNCSVEQMLMLLTRMGEHSRIVVTGDPSQSDLPRGQRSGLAHAVRVLGGVEGIGIVHLEIEDVVRHPLVGRIIAAYESERMELHGPREHHARPVEEGAVVPPRVRTH